MWLGPGPRGSLFRSREQLHDAWLQGRAEVMAQWAKNGRRPAGWWEFERPAGLSFNEDHEQSILWEAGILVGEEKAELEAWWWREFERAHSPDFFVSAGGKVLYGAKARRKHFRDVDIPRVLIEAWTQGRRRRTRTIRKLREGAPAPAQIAAKG